MAVAIQTVSTLAWVGKDNGLTITVDKPTDTADGDLLIAHLSGADDSANALSISAPAGWTSLGTSNVDNGSSSAGMFVFYKVAASEGANYTFTNASGFGIMMAAAIYRIDGQGSTADLQIAFDTDNTGDATPTFTNTVTQKFADSLALFLLSANGNFGSGSVSNYTITTNNPAWTEKYDQYGDSTAYYGPSDGDGLMSGATASRAEATATGDSTCTLSDAWSNSIGAMVIVPPVVNVTASPNVVDMTLSVQAPTVTGDSNFTVPASLDLTLSIQAPTVTTGAGTWTTTSKNSSTWTNTSKT